MLPCENIIAYIAERSGDLWRVNFNVDSPQMTGGTHSTNSLHYRRSGARAVDIPPTRKNWDILVPLAKDGTLQELFWRSMNPNYRNGQTIGPMDKHDHIHAGLGLGRWIPLAKASDDPWFWYGDD